MTDQTSNAASRPSGSAGVQFISGGSYVGRPDGSLELVERGGLDHPEGNRARPAEEAAAETVAEIQPSEAAPVPAAAAQVQAPAVDLAPDTTA